MSSMNEILLTTSLQHIKADVDIKDNILEVETEIKDNLIDVASEIYFAERGPRGFEGPVGPQGPKGEPGDPGPKGDPGSSGYTPIKGVDYFDGDVGPKGDPGYTPIKGVDYFDGEPGPKGEQGVQGIQGPRGEQGERGEKGEQGEKGKDGQNLMLSRTFESVSEMNSISGEYDGEIAVIASNVEDPDNAKMYVWNGSKWSFITDLSGAQGIKGDQGPQGVQGPQGEPGPKGEQGVQGIQGIQGIQGEQGPPGISTWGGITGSISNQIDLNSALNDKINKSTTANQTILSPLYVGNANSTVGNAFTHVRKVVPKDSYYDNRTVTGASFAVSFDGTAAFQHKSLDNNGANARNEAVLRFSPNHIQFATNSTAGATPAEEDYKDLAFAEDILTEEDVNNLIDAKLGVIENGHY